MHTEAVKWELHRHRSPNWAGVSRGTVDRVINRRGHVDPAVEAKIRQIAEELGYERNRAGSMLGARQRTWQLGVIVQSAETPLYPAGYWKSCTKRNRNCAK